MPVTISAATRSTIFSWNAGSFSDRGGSPMIMIAPVASRTSSGHHTNGRKRDETSLSGWSAAKTPISRRLIIRIEPATTVIATMWIVCTVGTIQLTLWIVSLNEVCSSHAQNSSSIRAMRGGPDLVVDEAGAPHAMRPTVDQVNGLPVLNAA